jgi:hypothetical protein
VAIRGGAVLYLTSAASSTLRVATDQPERNAARFVPGNRIGDVRELSGMSWLVDLFTIHLSRQETLAGSAAGKL